MSDEDGCFAWLGGIALGIFGFYVYNTYLAEDEAEKPDTFIARPTSDIPITAFDNKTEWVLDVSSVTGDRDARQGWIKSDHSNDQTTPYRYTMTLWRTNCDTKEYEKLESVAYSPDGKPQSIEIDKNRTFAVPDTNASGVVDTLCLKGFDPLNK